MYTKSVPFKDLNKKPRNVTLTFHLFEREVFKLLVELKYLIDWAERAQREDLRTLDPAEVVELYNNFEEVVLSAYGTPIDDGQGFDHDGRFAFEKTAAFNAFMVMCVKDPSEVGKFVQAILPEGMEDLVKAADENMLKQAEEADNATLRAQIEELRGQLNAGKGDEKAS